MKVKAAIRRYLYWILVIYIPYFYFLQIKSETRHKIFKEEKETILAIRALQGGTIPQTENSEEEQSNSEGEDCQSLNASDRSSSQKAENCEFETDEFMWIFVLCLILGLETY